MKENVTEIGDVIFSPFMVQASDLSDDLADKQLTLKELMSLGEVATRAINRFSPSE